MVLVGLGSGMAVLGRVVKMVLSSVLLVLPGSCRVGMVPVVVSGADHVLSSSSTPLLFSSGCSLWFRCGW